MATAFSQANLYELDGKDTSVTYTPAGFTGAPQLTYRSDDQDLVFRGQDVRKVDTEIGVLVTVDLSFTPDLETTTFSLLVPAVNLRNGSVEAPVETVGLLSTARTSIGGPALVQGQLISYQPIALAGKARLVDF
jgi:hypothetical protein